MARGTEEQKQAVNVGADFPYRTLMTHPSWKVIDGALAALEANDDMELHTARRYVIGYLIQELAERGQIPPAIAFRPDHSSADATSYRWILQVEVPERLPSKSSTSTRRRQVSGKS